MDKNVNHTKEQTVKFSAETVRAANIFERLSPELRAEILEILRRIVKK